jgi:hypothetical protein
MHLICASVRGKRCHCLDAKLQVLKSAGRLPVEYKANRRAWMTSFLFDKWLLKFDKQMRAIKHNFAVVLDNSAAHSLNTATLTNMLVFFFFHLIQ